MLARIQTVEIRDAIKAQQHRLAVDDELSGSTISG
jgi:hypothetical protein